jgi:glutamine synthetase
MVQADGIGNGTHIHWSLSDAAGGAVTHDPEREHGLSERAEHFAAGMLRHMPVLVALTAPSVASYYRLRPGRWAPTATDLAAQDRGSAIRVCSIQADSETVSRQFNVEFRVADATASPYLALGALVHAGLDGLRHRRRLADTKPAPLPASLSEALDCLEASKDAAQWLGAPLHATYLQFKRAEIASLAGLDEAEICRRYAAVY